MIKKKASYWAIKANITVGVFFSQKFWIERVTDNVSYKRNVR
eukprot:UN03645